MTSLEKYYSNPFADDADDICYAAVDFDRYESTSATSTPQQRARPTRAGAPSVHIDCSISSLGRNNGNAAAESGPAAADLQRQLDDAATTNQALHDEYENFIEALGEELTAAKAKCVELTANVDKLESQVRTLTFEKETAEWNVQLGKDRIQALENNVAALEGELANSRGTGARNSIQFDSAENRQQPTHQQPRPSYGPIENDPRGRDVPAAQTFQREGSHSNAGVQQSPQFASAPNAPRRRLVSVTHQEHQQRLQQQQQHPDRNSTGSTAAPSTSQAARRAKGTASVQELDAMLLFHSRRRDEVTSELQRLDGARLRSAGEKRRLETLEASLEEEERQIGHIRLLLRSQNAAKK